MGEIGYYINAISEELMSAIGNINDTLFWVIVLFGALQCFFGYKLFKVFLWIQGALIGAGVAILAMFLFQINTSGVAIVIFIIGILVGGFLMLALHQLGFLLLGGVAGALLVLLFHIVVQPIESGGPYIVMGCIVGVIAVALEKPLIIATTAISGSIIMVLMVALKKTPQLLSEHGDISKDYLLQYGAYWIFITIFGIFVQFQTTKDSVAQHSRYNIHKESLSYDKPTEEEYKLKAKGFNSKKAIAGEYQKGDMFYLEGMVFHFEDNDREGFILIPKNLEEKSVLCKLSVPQSTLGGDIVHIFGRYIKTLNITMMNEIEVMPYIFVDYLKVIKKYEGVSK
jgi:hypothetical protein